MNLKEVEELIRFVSKANVSEVELETKDVKLIIKTSRGQAEYRVETPMMAAPAPAAPAPAPVRSAAPQASAESIKAEAAASNDAKDIL